MRAMSALKPKGPTRPSGGWTTAALSAVLLLAACGRLATGMYQKRFNETNAMSLLKQYHVAQNFFQIEGHAEGRFGSLKELRKMGGSMIKEEMYRASDSHPHPQPYRGYLFSEISRDANGGPLDRWQRAGLAAYPAEPGASGDHVILMLLDLTLDDTQPPPHGGGFVSHGGNEWAFYSADASRIKGPVTSWPSATDLRTTWAKLRKQSPEEGLLEAREIFRSYQEQTRRQQR